MRPTGHPYRTLEVDSPPPPKEPRSKLPWVLLAAGALHAGLLGAAAFAPSPVASADVPARGPTITVLDGHVDESTGDVALSGYHVVDAPHH
jgi:hypothetical protein